MNELGKNLERKKDKKKERKKLKTEGGGVAEIKKER